MKKIRMLKRKAGQAIMVGIMIAIMVFIVGVIMIEPIKSMVAIARDSDHLDCTNISITTGERMTCILADMYLPYYFGVVVMAGLAFVGGKFAVRATGGL